MFPNRKSKVTRKLKIKVYEMFDIFSTISHTFQKNHISIQPFPTYNYFDHIFRKKITSSENDDEYLGSLIIFCFEMNVRFFPIMNDKIIDKAD